MSQLRDQRRREQQQRGVEEQHEQEAEQRHERQPQRRHERRQDRVQDRDHGRRDDGAERPLTWTPGTSPAAISSAPAATSQASTTCPTLKRGRSGCQAGSSP